ncbi:MAG: tripartite tricarboxylate transporter substrate binding protein [Pigmentiphaga sp.]|nr:tripartite tricarboxylate transporter substrate binding protein [Pigmentiphaga sp.]
MIRFTSVAAATLGACLVFAAPAQAQNYPTKPIHILVNGAPGSLPDLFARPIAEKMRQSLGQAVVVDNRPGAGGLLAMTHLKNSQPDGYTLAIVTNAHAVWNQYLFKELPYDTRKDLKPIAPVATIPMVLTAPKDFPANTIQETIELAKKQPGVLNYASSSVGSPPHVLFEMLKLQTKADILHVPFKSGPDAMNSTISGRTQLYLAGSALVEPMTKDGRLKALAVGTPERLSSFPNVPTFAEAGLPGHDNAVWLGMVTRSGVPDEVVGKLHQAINDAITSPDMANIFKAQGSAPYTSSTADFEKRIQEEHERWGPVIKEANISLD